MIAKRLLLVVLAVIIVLVAFPRAAEATLPPPHIAIGMLRLQIRGDRPHPFGSCEPQPVSHFHVELFKAIGGGRWSYVSNFHIGSLMKSDRRCFVVWNNYKPAMCYRTCGTGQSGLTTVLKTAILVVGVACGVAVSGAAAMILAQGASGTLYWMLP